MNGFFQMGKAFLQLPADATSSSDGNRYERTSSLFHVKHVRYVAEAVFHVKQRKGPGIPRPDSLTSKERRKDG